MLLSIVLALEAILVFFVTLVVYGTRALEPGPAFGGGLALIVAMAVAGRLLRYPVGIALGWVLQVALVLTGILVPLMYFIAVCFLAIWIYCFVKGRQIDVQKAAFAAATTPTEPTT
jgi:hypothetical protein